jgi:hypothetical protein
MRRIKANAKSIVVTPGTYGMVLLSQSIRLGLTEYLDRQLPVSCTVVCRGVDTSFCACAVESRTPSQALGSMIHLFLTVDSCGP